MADSILDPEKIADNAVATRTPDSLLRYPLERASCNRHLQYNADSGLHSSTTTITTRESLSLGNDSNEFEVGWEGKGDRYDPRNFGRARKWIIVIVLSLSSTSV